MNEFSVGKVLDIAWGFTKKHGLVMVGLLVLLMVVYYVVDIIFSMMFSLSALGVTLSSVIKDCDDANEAFVQAMTVFVAMFPLIMLYSFGMSIFATVVQTGYKNTALQLVNGKSNKVGFSTFKLPIMTFVKIFFASWLTSLLVGVALVFCILPGIFVFVRLMFVNIALIDDSELSFFDAYKKSWEITKGHFWELLLLGVVIKLIHIVGLLCCCVGVLGTAVLSEFAYVEAFVILSGKPVADPVAGVIPEVQEC